MRRRPRLSRVTGVHVEDPPDAAAAQRHLAAPVETLAVALITMVTGRGPQENVITPPAATARITACEVQLAGVPWPITWSG
jgi:hypothetical protein